MNPPRGEDLAEATARLRRAFDPSVAEPTPPRPWLDVVAVRVAGAGLGLRRADVSGVLVDRRIVPLPGAAPTVLGLTSIRGCVLPIHSLARILGLDPLGGERWIVWLGGETPVGYAFEALDGLLRVEPGDVSPGHATYPFQSGAVRVGDALLPLLDLPGAPPAGVTGRSAPTERR